MKTEDKYEATEEDLTRIAELAGVELLTQDESENLDEALLEGDLDFSIEIEKTLLNEMAHAAFATTLDEDSFFVFWCENRERIRDAALMSDEVAEMLLLGFKLAINNGSALSMNCLGALYYMGDIVEQDYEKAAELYERAMDAGCYQSIINLGYIYEYGRIGKPDYDKAYQFYSLAAALAPSSEAIYKLGDMFSRGKAVPRDTRKAFALYKRSLQLAEGDVEVAQPAIRLANILIDPMSWDFGVDADPLEALRLFQMAEIGLRKDIADGQYYYERRLQEALEGQKKAREMIESGEEWVID